MIDPTSETWEAVRSHCESRLRDLRAALERPGTTPEQTEFLRGSIAEVRSLRNLHAGKRPPEID